MSLIKNIKKVYNGQEKVLKYKYKSNQFMEKDSKY